MDTQWDLLMSDNPLASRFYQLKCRIAAANSIQSSILLLIISLNFFRIFYKSFDFLLTSFVY